MSDKPNFGKEMRSYGNPRVARVMPKISLNIPETEI